MLYAMNGNSLLMENEIEKIKEFAKVNLTALIPSGNWTSSKVWNENDTALDIKSGNETHKKYLINKLKKRNNFIKKFKK